MRLCLAAILRSHGSSYPIGTVGRIGGSSKQVFLVAAAGSDQHLSLVTSNPGSHIARHSHGGFDG